MQWYLDEEEGNGKGEYIGSAHGYIHTYIHMLAFLPLVVLMFEDVLMFEACLLSNVHHASEESIAGINAEEGEVFKSYILRLPSYEPVKRFHRLPEVPVLSFSRH